MFKKAAVKNNYDEKFVICLGNTGPKCLIDQLITNYERNSICYLILMNL